MSTSAIPKDLLAAVVDNSYGVCRHLELHALAEVVSCIGDLTGDRLVGLDDSRSLSRVSGVVARCTPRAIWTPMTAMSISRTWRQYWLDSASFARDALLVAIPALGAVSGLRAQANPRFS